MLRNCHVCGSDQHTYLYKPSKSPGAIVRCNNCNFVFVNPIDNMQSLIQVGPVLDDRPESLLTGSDLSAIKGSWEEPIIEMYMQEADAKRDNAREALTHLHKALPQPGKLLDFGSFCGLFLSVAAAEGWECYGLEPLVMPSIYARGHFGLNITTDTLHETTFPESFFDAVTAFQVFEHIVDPAPEIEKLRAFLKVGGYIMIEVPNIDNWSVRLMGVRHRHFVQDHVSFFSGDTLSRFLGKQGFEVCEVYYPQRVLSLSHLADWLRRLTTQGIGDALEKTLKLANLDQKKLRLGVGDIVSVVAVKR